MCVFVCTYHSPLPNDTHPVLNSSHSMRDLCEVLLTQSSLLDAKWTVLWCHNTQSVTGNRMLSSGIVFYFCCESCILGYKYIYVCTEHLPAQQAHEVAGSVGIKTERRNDDVGGSMSPVLVVILHPIQHCVSYCGLCMDHLTCRDRTERKRGKWFVTRR